MAIAAVRVRVPLRAQIMKCQYSTHGTCSRSISYDIDPKSHIVGSIVFTGGCNGNLKGIAAMAEGLRAEDIIPRLKGICCGVKPTSCPDQLATALEESLAQLNQG